MGPPEGEIHPRHGNALGRRRTAMLNRSPARKHKGLAAWLARERVLRLIPFVMVEGLFITLLAIPFLLTIYISSLRWRANRPFEQAAFSGLINFESVILDAEFWAALGRTFAFAGVA